MTTKIRRPRSRRQRALGALAATVAGALLAGLGYAATAPDRASGAEGDFTTQALSGVAFKAPRIIVRGDVTTAGVPIPGATPGTIVPGFGVFDGAGVGTVPTSLALSPVQKQLYVATQFGKIFVFNLDANHNASLVSTITTISSTPNQDFHGIAKAKTGRQTTGIAFAPPSQQPGNGNAVLYVSHSDPEIFDEAEPGTSKVNPSSGIVSRLIVDPAGTVLQRIDLVTGLPRSGENHSINGMAFGPDGLLYLGVAGNTNGGGQSKPFAWFPEVPLGSSVVKINPAAIMATPAGKIDVSVGARFQFTNPCGGGTVPNGCTAAYTLTGSQANNGTQPNLLEIYATGFRNPYDLLWHTNGKLYLNENEGNPGIGPLPGPSLNNPSAPCPGPAAEIGVVADQLFLVQPGGYHGHPNPSRNQCVHSAGVQPIGSYFFAAASTGIAEFTPFVFGPALQGQLLTTNYGVSPGGGVGDTISRVQLSPDGTSVVEVDNKFLTGFNDPLDVVVDTDGTVIVAEHGFKQGNFGKISVLEPLGTFACPAPGDPAAVDSDGDGFKDADEIAAGFNHCNPSSAPPDADGDKISDALDPDDDNDGIPDVQDRFQLDPTNGAGTTLPWVQDFAGSGGGGYFGSGFLGVQLSSKGGGAKLGKVGAGAAGGYLQVIATPGTAQGASNNQDNALQQGFKPTAPATVSAIVGQPFGTQPKPEGGELGGIFLGAGEDDFVRLSVHANNGSPVVEFGKEQAGTFQRVGTPAPVSLPQSSVRLFLDLDPGTDAVRARYQVGTGEVVTLGTVAVPGTWLDTVAAGVMTTTAGSPKTELAFIYDEFRIEAGPALPKPPDAGGNDGQRAIKVIDGQLCRAVPARPKSGGKGKFKLDAGQMLIEQRISQAAVRRSNAVQARLDGKLSAKDLCGGAIGAQHFGEGVETATGSTHTLEASDPSRITAPARRAQGEASKVTLSAKQLLINQRVSQAAVRRSNALRARLDAGLTGGDLKTGQIGLGQLAEGLRIVSARQVGTPPRASRTVVKSGASGRSSKVTLSIRQLQINQRIAQAAVRRTNALIDRLETGLLSGDFKKGTISAISLDPSLRS